jgi:hypothetical protein
MNISFIVKAKILVLIKCSYRSPTQIMLSNEARLPNIFRACSAITFEQMPFWCPFFDQHLTTHHFNIGVQLR